MTCIAVLVEKGQATTGCGKTVKLERPTRPFAPQGLTGWGSEITCPGCLTRRRPS